MSLPKQPGWQTDRNIIFYPSYAHLDVDGDGWAVHVQGCIFDPKVTWLRRRAMLGIIRRVMQVKRAAAAEHFRDRMLRFLVDHKSDRSIDIRLGDREYHVGRSEEAGLFRGIVPLPADELDRLASAGEIADGWLRFMAAANDGRQPVEGAAQLIARHGLSIISDVDDTIKHSNVPDRRDLFHNMFVRTFAAIPGMAELYRSAADRGAVFHYVSASPWQLYEPLSEFWRVAGFPRGSFHLKMFRWRNTLRRLRGRTPQQVYKRASIDPILAAFPERQFVLVGDSGEQDPQIYGELARLHPQRIAGVFIRNVSDASPDSPRFQQAFADVAPERWRLFRDPAEIAPLLEKLLPAPRTSTDKVTAG